LQPFLIVFYSIHSMLFVSQLLILLVFSAYLHLSRPVFPIYRYLVVPSFNQFDLQTNLRLPHCNSFVLGTARLLMRDVC